ncbi:OC116 protein, partial [Aegotheles bennettii]|nr:OC116 protein [Aegotheles bennettii]
MQTALVCFCLCLLSTALSTPVTPAITFNKKTVRFGSFLPQQILLKGCNGKHSFYVFEYVYSISTRRNQTQIK